jgi:hypothetical protein
MVVRAAHFSVLCRGCESYLLPPGIEFVLVVVPEQEGRVYLKGYGQTCLSEKQNLVHLEDSPRRWTR